MIHEPSCASTQLMIVKRQFPNISEISIAKTREVNCYKAACVSLDC